jgi:hypothetical protein
MSADRTRVYVAREGFMGDYPGHRSNIRESRLVVESHPGPGKDPTRWRLVGTVDAATAAMVEAYDDEATLRTFGKEITPIGFEPSERTVSPRATDAAQAPEPPSPRKEKGRRGRPKGTRMFTRKQIVEVNQRLRNNYGRNPTQAELLANLEPRSDRIRTLQEALDAYELTWPINE